MDDSELGSNEPRLAVGDGELRNDKIGGVGGEVSDDELQDSKHGGGGDGDDEHVAEGSGLKDNKHEALKMVELCGRR